MIWTHIFLSFPLLSCPLLFFLSSFLPFLPSFLYFFLSYINLCVCMYNISSTLPSILFLLDKLKVWKYWHSRPLCIKKICHHLSCTIKITWDHRIVKLISWSFSKPFKRLLLLCQATKAFVTYIFVLTLINFKI